MPFLPGIRHASLAGRHMENIHVGAFSEPARTHALEHLTHGARCRDKLGPSRTIIVNITVVQSRLLCDQQKPNDRESLFTKEFDGSKNRIIHVSRVSLGIWELSRKDVQTSTTGYPHPTAAHEISARSILQTRHFCMFI